MNSINLLPTDFRANKDVVHIAALMTRLAVVAGVILLIGGAVGGGVLYLMQNQATESEKVRNNLRSQIQNLESTENKFILIKDRIAKSQNILNQRGKFTEFDNYKDLVLSLPAGTTFVEEELDSSISKITISAQDSATLVSVLDTLETNSKFVRASIEKINFSPTKGYELILNLF